MRAVAHTENEVHGDHQNKSVAEYVEDIFAEVDFGTSRVDSGVRQRSSDKVEGEVEVGEGEVGEKELNELVDEFDMQKDLSHGRVAGLPDLLEMEKRVDGSEEGTVEPTTTLRDEFGDRVYPRSLVMDIDSTKG